ncbi:xanthine dehydrogenase family protein molybdopterin-binding subunit [Enterovirga sp.]|uniref:xanthine dehydrogenase family protein molybdopterin-binding subunit n=1 Tax=Enterovirga sp. TaxID=2026350 RepID=UPI002624454B|nr:xanthine dehydrogenase family protein molybdopterin-binding subunit [Enterovirga sp.]MDB5589993.1 aldehyde oxidase and xanthine dehydrogenase molybdopterin binding [Enterovirga sp.]
MLRDPDLHVGAPRSRIDGVAKVTGEARYAAEHRAPDLAHGIVVSGAIARGRITSIDSSAALAVPGVIQVFTHENRRSTAWLDYNYQDEVAPPGSPFRPLYDAEIHFSGQPVALVVAEDYDAAAYAASLVRITYEAAEHATSLEAQAYKSYVPPKKRSGIKPPSPPRGDAPGAFTASPVMIEADYTHAVEHHNPMEPHASTVIWEGDGKLTVHDKTQGPQNSHSYVVAVFGLKADDVQVKNAYVGGAFGLGLRPHYQLFLAVMAALELKRSVRVVLTRDQMFTLSYRPHSLQTVKLGADRNGKLNAVIHAAVSGTSRFEDYQEDIVNWSGFLYQCDNAAFSYELAKLDTYTPSDMRAPGAATGMFAVEIAMDELAAETGTDPVELRLRNYADKDENQDKPFTSKELRACYAQAAERFGWSRRNPEPRATTEGRELVGWGMASGIWEAFMQKASARARLAADGTLEVATATSDIGTGTYTILAQIGADALGLRMEQVSVKIGDSSLPTSPIEGGSWTAASNGSAVMVACTAVREELFRKARGLDGSPLANVPPERVVFRGGRIAVADDPSRSVAISEVMRAAGLEVIEREETAQQDPATTKRYASYTHSAIFAEVKVDEDLGVVRVTRVVVAVAAGKIINPKTARSQILGGVVMGIGMALHEETMADHNLGRFMNHNLAEYHVPANADIHDIEVIFVEEHDDKISPIGVKGLGEIGIVGTAAAVANAIFHATGKRVRSLPITLDKLL